MKFSLSSLIKPASFLALLLAAVGVGSIDIGSFHASLGWLGLALYVGDSLRKGK